MLKPLTLNSLRWFFILLMHLGVTRANAQEYFFVENPEFLLTGVDLRVAGDHSVEVHVKRLFPHRFSYQVKLGYSNTSFLGAPLKFTPKNYSGTVGLEGRLQGYTFKFGYIMGKHVTKRANLLTFVVNACIAYGRYDLAVVTHDPSYALYGDHTDTYQARKIFPGLETELHYGKLIIGRLYLNLALVGGVKPAYNLFTDVVQGNHFGYMVPGQGASKGWFYANGTIGLGLNIYPELQE